jgi:hypothetical protein
MPPVGNDFPVPTTAPSTVGVIDDRNVVTHNAISNNSDTNRFPFMPCPPANFLITLYIKEIKGVQEYGWREMPAYRHEMPFWFVFRAFHVLKGHENAQSKKKKDDPAQGSSRIICDYGPITFGSTRTSSGNPYV